jgi:hypothetical protein
MAPLQVLGCGECDSTSVGGARSICVKLRLDAGI